MECGKMQSLFGVAVGKLQLAQRDILEVMEHMYPGFIIDEQRSEWLRKLMGADIAIMDAKQKVEDAAAEIHPDGKRPPAHPEVSEQSSQDQPTACENCRTCRLLLKELALAIRVGNWDVTIQKVDQFLADPAGECGEWSRHRMDFTLAERASVEHVRRLLSTQPNAFSASTIGQACSVLMRIAGFTPTAPSDPATDAVQNTANKKESD